MKKYLARLHKKPDHHKKQFALLASGTITLLIFGIWSLATFGLKGDVVAENNDVEVVAVEKENEISPLQSLKMSLADALAALKSSMREIKSNIESADLETQYTEMRDSSLKVYGQ